MALLIGVGLVQAAGHGFEATPPPPIEPVEGLTVLLVLRAFSCGATSMTGIEAIAQRRARVGASGVKNASIAMT